MKLNVICLLWQGDFRGRDFSEEDVRRLYQSVRRHIGQEFDFYTLTNNSNCDTPGRRILLENSWPGWWSKMELYRSDLPKGRTLYLDLDSRVIRDLSPLLKTKGDLVMFPSRASGPRSGSKKVVQKYQASAMLFTPGNKIMKDVWNRFSEEPELFMDKFRSDQDLIGEWYPDLNTFPSKWLEKLRQCKRTSPPDDALIITGQPKGYSFREEDRFDWLSDMAR